VRPSFFGTFNTRPLAWLFVAIAAGGAAATLAGVWRTRDGLTFAGTSAFIGGLLAATAACAWPALLYGVPDAAHSLTVANAAAPDEGLRRALAWYVPGLLLAFGYLAVLARLHRDKARAGDYGSHG